MLNKILWWARLSQNGATKKPPSKGRYFCSLENALGAGHIDRGRALLTVDDFEADDIANLEFIERHAGELLGVEEQVLHFAFASDETESTIRERLDSTSHNGAALCSISLESGKLDYIPRLLYAHDNSFL